MSIRFETYAHKLGKASRQNLKGVLPKLISVAELAIVLCEYDGTVIPGGGLRTQAQANENQRNGTGIPNSRHLKQLEDGYSHAIDLIALTEGKIVWSNTLAFEAMAWAIKRSGAILQVPLRQGPDWNMNGLFGETKEWDWSHFEDPLPIHMDRAIAEMHRYRKQLLAEDYDIRPEVYLPGFKLT